MEWSPEHIALLSEAGLASHSLSSGLASFRKANYAEDGFYHHAFFGLSIGMERTMKLIYVVDRFLVQGSFPTDEDLRGIGHDLDKLMVEVDRIGQSNGAHQGSAIVPGSIEDDIIRFLSEFAKSTRYYNLDFLSKSKRLKANTSPLAKWYDEIGLSI